MTKHLAVRPSGHEPGRGRLSAFEVRLAERERELAAMKSSLQDLQTRYFERVGALYAELTALDHAITDEEIRVGLRPPPSDDDGPELDDRPASDNPAAPSQDLKRVFRDLAKAIHPDLALDEPARCRRHSLMAEANRAYAERDEDRLRLILRVWQRTPESVFEDGPEGGRLSIERQIAEIDEQLLRIDAEFADLRTSAIGQLDRKINDAKAQGWDLFAEMVLQVKREIARATAELASLRRQTGASFAARAGQ